MRKEKRKEAENKSCADCWSVLRPNPNDTSGFPFGWSDADAFYFVSLNSALTSLRIRLKLAQKVAGTKEREVNKIECKVESLHEKLKKILDVNTKQNSFPKPDQNASDSHNKNFDFSLTSFLSKFFATSNKSSKRNKIKSLNLVPLPKVSVIADGRDSDIKLLVNSRKNVSEELIFHIAVDVSLLETFSFQNKVHLYEVPKNASRGTIYNMLMKKVKSAYTLVASDLHYLHRNAKLNKLMSYLSTADVWAVTGGTLSPQNKWQNGCLQSTFKNFRATFHRKHIAWLNGCSVCSVLDGPFLALTPILRTLEWNEHFGEDVTSLDLFLRSFHYHHYIAASCFDSLFPLRTRFKPYARAEIVELARYYRLKEVHLPQSLPVVLTCLEVTDVCRESGEMVSPCCLAELAKMIKFFLSTCEAHRLYCELQEGSLLGAVKFGDVLPWEKDADITFHTANFSAIQELMPVFSKAGFTLKLTDNRWCCVNGSEAGGEGKLIGNHWIVELYSQHAMDSEEMARAQIVPTKVELHGGWVRSPRNPSEYARNRYGLNIFRHSQHWLDLGKLSGWEQYSTDSFSPCGLAGHHSCLDLNPTDGAAQFDLPCG